MGDRRDILGTSRPRPVGQSRASAGATTPAVYAATPGKRAARPEQLSAADRANAATSPYAGRRVADRPVDAPSGTLTLPDLAAYARVGVPSASAAVMAPESPVRARLDVERLDTASLDPSVIDAVLSGLEPVDHSTSFAEDATAQLPMQRAAVVHAPGRRRATKHSGRRGPLFRGLPSVSLLLGVAALAISAGGAITAGGADLAASPQRTLAATGALGGQSAVGSVGVAREGQVTSRDTDRQAVVEPTAAIDPAVEAKARARTDALAADDKDADKRSQVIEENQWQTPLASYRLTARFGQYGLWSSYHTGLDFAAPSGTQIRAIANGVVTSAGYDGSYGNKTVVTLDDGTELWYCHQTSFAVSVGDAVRGGELIGYVGSTGNTTGPHVHIEVRPGGGDPVDPYPAFIEHGVTP